MKSLLSLLAILFAVNFSYAQTNTFPTSGDVGIGTTSPLSGGGAASWLTLNGTSTYSGGNVYSIGGVAKGFSYIAPDGLLTQEAEASTGQKFVVNGTTTAITIPANGNVGIGTTSPSENLSVAGSSTSGSISLVPGPSTYAGYKLALTTQAANEGFNMTMGGTKIMSAYGYNDADEIGFGNLGHENLLYLNSSGNVGIGTTTPDTKLAVNGTIHSKEVKVDLSVPGPDYVFDSDYQLTGLSELKAYLDKNHHLPEIPSANQMAKDGLNLGEMNTKLLKKVEELTLYLINENKEKAILNNKVSTQQTQIDHLKQMVETLSKEIHKN